MHSTEHTSTIQVIEHVLTKVTTYAPSSLKLDHELLVDNNLGVYADEVDSVELMALLQFHNQRNVQSEGESKEYCWLQLNRSMCLMKKMVKHEAGSC